MSGSERADANESKRGPGPGNEMPGPRGEAASRQATLFGPSAKARRRTDGGAPLPPRGGPATPPWGARKAVRKRAKQKKLDNATMLTAQWGLRALAGSGVPLSAAATAAAAAAAAAAVVAAVASAEGAGVDAAASSHRSLPGGAPAADVPDEGGAAASRTELCVAGGKSADLLFTLVCAAGQDASTAAWALRVLGRSVPLLETPVMLLAGFLGAEHSAATRCLAADAVSFLAAEASPASQSLADACMCDDEPTVRRRAALASRTRSH